jgi:hypothetical protein
MHSFRHFFCLLIFSPMIVCSQDKTKSVNDVLRISFLHTGLSYEKRIGELQTIYGQVFLQPSIHFNSDFSIDKHESYIDPAFSFQYRYYYNSYRRQKKSKRTEMNSMNYFSPSWTTIFSKERFSVFQYFEDKKRPINYIGIVWGFQRNYKSRFSLDINIGPSYLFTKSTMSNNNGTTYKINYNEFLLFADINIGLWLNKRK